MSVFKIEKVIGSVPETISPDCIYLVRTGSGFDLYASDTTGSIAHALNGGAGGSINDLLSIPLARLDYFDHAIVIQDGELRRMSYADFVETVQPGFDPAPINAVYIGTDFLLDDSGQFVVYVLYEQVSRLIYNDSIFVFGNDILFYAEDSVLTYGDTFLLYGDEEVLKYSSEGLPEFALYYNDYTIYDESGGYVSYDPDSLYVEAGYVEAGYF